MVSENTIIDLSSVEKMFKDEKVYKLSAAPFMSNGNSQIIGSEQIAAFNRLGNWYVTVLESDGKVPRSPEAWSLITHPDNPSSTRFYHGFGNGTATTIDTELEMLLKKINLGLTVKRQHGRSELSTINKALTSKEMMDIILSKEKSGSGFQLGGQEPLNGFINRYGHEIFRVSEEELKSPHLQFGTSPREQLVELHKALGKPFEIVKANNSLVNGHINGNNSPTKPSRIFYVPAQGYPPYYRVEFGIDENGQGIRTVKPVNIADAKFAVRNGSYFSRVPDSLVDELQGMVKNHTEMRTTPTAVHTNGHIPELPVAVEKPTTPLPQQEVKVPVHEHIAVETTTSKPIKEPIAAANANNIHVPPTKSYSPKSESTFAKIITNEVETEVGKKGLVFAAAAVAIGGVVYAASKMFGKKSEQEEKPSWVKNITPYPVNFQNSSTLR